MIYLLDDKRSRQNDYGWTDSKFAKYAENIVAIHSFAQIADKEKRQEIFHGSNTVLFHESFFDNAENAHRKNAIEIRNELSAFPVENPNFKIVYFSGSQDSRKNDGNIAFMPVSILYQNLEAFLVKAEQGIKELEYLLFGTNANIEEILVEQLKRANNDIEEELRDSKPDFKVLIAQSVQDSIELIFDNSDYKTFYLEERFNFDVTNEYLDAKVREWFEFTEYDAIFIPLCFGPTLSDFNGLRMATHIRCTETLNQTKHIFIYSFTGYDQIIDHPYFDIIKTKNVRLIEYKKAAFSDAVTSLSYSLNRSDLPLEIQKISLRPPEDIGDNHSVANEWAIFRWAMAIDAYDKDIEQIINKVDRQLYFKYLKTLYPQETIKMIPESQLRLDYSGSSKVLYIDDEAEKGWYEIICKIVGDINKISFQHLDDEFNEKSSDEIVRICLDKIVTDQVDVVILDFRLHRDDFKAVLTEDITSIKLLEKIKKQNPGIQVIIFSATNKIWNLQALQEAGADGFILKDFGKDLSHSIENFLKIISSCIKKASWLKQVWSKTETVLLHLDEQRRKHQLDKDFVGAMRTYLELSFDSLRNESSKFPFDTAFVYYFLILEAASSQLIDDKKPIKIQYCNTFGETKPGYNFQFRKTYDLLKDFEGNQFTRTNPGDALISQNTRIPYNPKFHNLIDWAGLTDVNPVHLVKLRNEFSHPNLVENRSIARIEKEDCLQLFDVCFSLLKKL